MYFSSSFGDRLKHEISLAYDAFILFISWSALLYFSIYTDEMEMMFLLVFSAGKVGSWKCFS